MILGITGGPGTGKSAATAQLAELGVRTLDCDALARQLSSSDPAVLSGLALAFPEAFGPNDVLDRAALAQLVFADANRRAVLESLLHPPIMGVVAANIDLARKRGRHLAVEVPLLFEGGYESYFDKTWVITASREIQIERLLRRPGLTDRDVEALIVAQLPLADKELRSDGVIVNNGTLVQLHEAVTQEWERLIRETQS